MSKLTPKIILEGTRLTFKTDIAFELNEHPRIVGPRKYRYHSPLVSGEWCAFTNFPWGRGLINFEPQEEALARDAPANDPAAENGSLAGERTHTLCGRCSTVRTGAHPCRRSADPCRTRRRQRLSQVAVREASFGAALR